jgi:hypothetical protein
VKFGLCRSARSIALTSRSELICGVGLWESGLFQMGIDYGSESMGVANWGPETLGEGGRFWSRA